MKNYIYCCDKTQAYIERAQALTTNEAAIDRLYSGLFKHPISDKFEAWAWQNEGSLEEIKDYVFCLGKTLPDELKPILIEAALSDINDFEDLNEAKVVLAKHEFLGLIEQVKSDLKVLPDYLTKDPFLKQRLGDRALMPVTQKTLDTWGNSMNDYVAKLPSQNLTMPFFSWCIQQMKFNLEAHQSHCEKGKVCGTDIGYQRRMDLLKRRMEELQPAQTEAMQNPKPINQIQWLGTQKELAELFIRLKEKGWISGFEYETIKACFTNSNSIQQVLKPGQDPKTKQATFDQVFTKDYTSQFHGIQQNPKKNTTA